MQSSSPSNRAFHCLKLDCPIFGPHLLEASAGTGKTFAIEHVVVRLLLESEEMEIEQILAVTFTRSAARDLKKRIRSNIQEALSRIQSGSKGWEYLDPHLFSAKSAKKLEGALLVFDRCQIFTIHGFCYRSLQEFAFEADLGFFFPDPDREIRMPKRLYGLAKKFLQTGVSPDLLCLEQMARLLQKCDTQDQLIRKLLQKKTNKSVPFSMLFEQFQANEHLALIAHSCETCGLKAFERIRSNYKAEVKGDFEAQIEALASMARSPLDAFRKLLREKGSLFAFLDPKNRKIKATEKCPEFFEMASKTIYPLIQEAMHPGNVFSLLQNAWKEIEEPILLEEQCFGPDEILHQMRVALNREGFACCVRQKYRAVIIDEFQDTDPMQWEILKTLFLDIEKPLMAFYLVGDPKQSIYRFRKADIYTYFEARASLGASALYCLDTNYRSSSDMVSVLNALFERDWLFLPKLKTTIPSFSVQSGREIQSDFSDHLGSVHFILTHSFEECSLPYAVGEIERLFPLLKTYSSFAILVKDRYQSELALRCLQKQGIPAYARSHIPLGKTLAFQSIYELFRAMNVSYDNALIRTVAAGPFASFHLGLNRSILESQGLIAFCRQILACEFPDPEFQRDLTQIVEEILMWEGSKGFSFQGLLRFLSDFEELNAEEGGRRRVEPGTDALQVLTLHVSKGLEFDVVFALGLSSRSLEEDDEEEAQAEKLRQLYVAMTRAKKRLYVPLSENQRSRGSLSSMELFCQTIESQEGDFLSFLRTIEHVTYEELPEKISLDPVSKSSAKIDVQQLSIPPKGICSYLYSFTTLAQPKPFSSSTCEDGSSARGICTHTIPKGTETGIIIHHIFEKLFSAYTPIWQDLRSVESLVSKYLQDTSLLPWENVIRQMVWNTLNLKIDATRPNGLGIKPFSLMELMPEDLQTEMEFLFSKPPHFVKGYIDLVFKKEEKFFFLDWKTNWLGPDAASYLDLEAAMTAHDYWLQADIYATALEKHVKRFYTRGDLQRMYTQPFDEIFGGAIYLFLRGGRYYHFKPEF
ncbi:MAG TPA: UvrD-helicase domain-containing protein [Chlamydiales bacterium]|nr:UvrD-helicase domain-containing protein [Chlamydiales bacterium]